ncbi:MAG: leucine-rich repeat domain-containing protein [Gemmatimonadetes bacterium]|nr:leucine-rich repeat domain-containing protein [Gemmatimonadota bacterium]
MGDTLRLAASATDANGQVVTGAELAWASADTAVAVVDASGLVTGVAEGQAQVSATAAGLTGRASLTVAAPTPTAVAVMPDTVVLTALGQTMQLTAEVRDQAGRAMDGVPVAWSSGDTTVAVVDSAGLVSAVSGGAATVTATASEASGNARVIVMQSADSVTVSPPAATVALGDTLRLVADAYDAGGHVVVGAVFTWSSSSTAVATVDTSGLVRGAGEGTATITATTGDASGASEITVVKPDRAALIALYNATDGPNWINNDNWTTDAPLELWFGVNADASGRVHALSLNSNRLRGTIPPALGNLAYLRHLELASNELSGAIPRELGELTRLTYLNLGPNRLVDPLPPELGNLTNLDWLNLQDNNLQGPLPPALGQLFNLRVLGLQNNKLKGPLPPWLLELDVNLDFFSYEGNDGFCTPGTATFIQWRQKVDSRGFVQGPLCHEDDIAGLEALYDATAGAGWSDAEGWLEGPVLDDWYGVQTDSTGRVTELDLSRNGLTGHLPSQLGRLTAATTLRLGENALSGRLPQSLTALVLREFSYSDTGLCTPSDASFRKWLNSVPLHNGTGMECAPLSDRDILQTLYDASGGPGWTRSDNWLTDAPLRTWHGVTTNGQGRVVSLGLWSNELSGDIPAELGHLMSLQTLSLQGNRLTGSIPPELGSLTNLETLRLDNNQLTGDIPAELGHLMNLQTLHLWRNRLTGSIPPELGNLTNLSGLWLPFNRLTGSIPPELGNLTNLRSLWLRTNQLAGMIPSELGNLTNLRSLSLQSNQLTGEIPAELGRLANLQTLSLRGNRLTGSIPPEIGSLTDLGHLSLVDNSLAGRIPPTLGALSKLETLHLVNNHLEGPVPPEFGGLTSLRELSLSRNKRMSGALPHSLTALARLEAFVAESTELCAPTDADFLNWLDGIAAQRIARCSGSPSMAYVTQAIQSPEFPVALVANEEALLRVFATAARSNAEDIPPVRATLYANGAQALVVDVPSKPGPIPIEVREWSLSSSANAGIPAHLVQPGLEIVIEVDPAGTLDPVLGVTKRIPETGRLPVDVRTMPLFDLTVIPFLWSESADSSILEITEGLNADSDLLFETRTLLPVDDFKVTVHAPVSSSSNNTHVLIGETSAIRVMEGGSGHYMGTMVQPVTGGRGLAALPGRVSFSTPEGWIMAHELGHNMSLLHPWENPVFPSYPNGNIGAWGYDFRRGGQLVPPDANDIMLGCCWISDFHFDQALRFRERDAGGVGASRGSAATPVESLLIWGGVGADSAAFLEPVFVVDAPPALPDSAGEFRIAGRTAGGGQLFSFSFTMPETADGDGSSSFAFALPVRAGWEGSLATITLSGPNGSVTLNGDSDVSMAILRDPRTGQVRGILRDLPDPTQAARDGAGNASGQELEVLFSRGIPDAAAWRRWERRR